jgi:hypothetical protein
MGQCQSSNGIKVDSSPCKATKDSPYFDSQGTLSTTNLASIAFTLKGAFPSAHEPAQPAKKRRRYAFSSCSKPSGEVPHKAKCSSLVEENAPAQGEELSNARKEAMSSVFAQRRASCPSQKSFNGLRNFNETYCLFLSKSDSFTTPCLMGDDSWGHICTSVTKGQSKILDYSIRTPAIMKTPFGDTWANLDLDLDGAE